MKKRLSGIYRILNKVNGKGYVGGSKDLEDRWPSHRQQLNRKDHHSILLQRSWDKHGEDKFVFEILEYVDESKGQKYLREREQYWIDFYDAANPDKGYNISKKAQCVDIPPYERTADHKKEMSEKLMGRVLTEEWKQKISKTRLERKIPSPTKGRKLTPDQIQKMVEGHLGKPLSEEHKEKLSIAFSGENNPFFGKKHTKEFCDKLSILKKGNTNFLGKQHSDETKEKISKANLGRHASEESRAKMSLARKGKKQNPWQGFRISQTKLHLNMAKRFFQISGVN